MSSQIKKNQVIEIPEGFPDPADFEKAVVFIRSDWSGPAKISMTYLREAFKSGLDESWKLVILNNDKLGIEAFVNAYGPFPSSGGWGEAFWVKDGKIIYRDRGYHNVSLVRLLAKRIQEFSSRATIDFSIPSSYPFVESALKQCGGFDSDRLEIYDLDCRDISDLLLAVVNLYHCQHGASVATLRNLARELKQFSDPFRLVVLNADAVPFADMNCVFNEYPRSSRTYWIRDGKIIFKDEGFFRPWQMDLLKKRIKAFRQR